MHLHRQTVPLSVQSPRHRGCRVPRTWPGLGDVLAVFRHRWRTCWVTLPSALLDLEEPNPIFTNHDGQRLKSRHAHFPSCRRHLLNLAQTRPSAHHGQQDVAWDQKARLAELTKPPPIHLHDVS
jgi:hypothetical protein